MGRLYGLSEHSAGVWSEMRAEAGMRVAPGVMNGRRTKTEAWWGRSGSGYSVFDSCLAVMSTIDARYLEYEICMSMCALRQNCTH